MITVAPKHVTWLFISLFTLIAEFAAFHYYAFRRPAENARSFSSVAYPQPPNPTKCNSATYQEAAIITLTILMEARGEGQEGMHAVASVIWNRSLERKQPFWQTCLAKNQFSCWNQPVHPTKIKELVESPQAHLAWNMAIAMISRQFKDSTNGANHYHALSVTPSWSKGRTPIKIVRNHIFFKL
jgi:spore germination cell wall hydrolase CwlJ-like protein